MKLSSILFTAFVALLAAYFVFLADGAGSETQSGAASSSSHDEASITESQDTESKRSLVFCLYILLTIRFI